MYMLITFILQTLLSHPYQLYQDHLNRVCGILDVLSYALISITEKDFLP